MHPDTPHRASVKDRKSSWKEKVREDCRQRARHQREVWLKRYREAKDRDQEKAVISAEIHDIVGNAIVTDSLGGMAISADDSMFQEEIIPERASSYAEFIEQMREFEETLIADFVTYAELKSEIDAEASQEVDSLGEVYVSGTTSEAQGFLCPVCKQTNLLTKNCTISCPVDRFRIDLSIEGISVESLKDRLSKAYIDHRSNCSGTLEFFVQSEFGPSVLCAKCEDCHILQTVATEMEETTCRSGQTLCTRKPSKIEAQEFSHICCSERQNFTILSSTFSTSTSVHGADGMVTDTDLDFLTADRVFDILLQLYAPYPASLLKRVSKDHIEKALGSKKPLVYGELTFASLCSMLREALRHVQQAHNLTFYDLGSGSGKQVLSAALHEAAITVARGIEIIPEMHGIACTVLTRLQREFLPAFDFPDKLIEFKCADIFQVDWSDGDIVLLNSTCFTKNMMATLEERLQSLKSGSVIITLTKKLNNPRFAEVACRERRMSWGSAHVYFYQCR